MVPFAVVEPLAARLTGLVGLPVRDCLLVKPDCQIASAAQPLVVFRPVANVVLLLLRVLVLAALGILHGRTYLSQHKRRILLSARAVQQRRSPSGLDGEGPAPLAGACAHSPTPRRREGPSRKPLERGTTPGEGRERRTDGAFASTSWGRGHRLHACVWRCCTARSKSLTSLCRLQSYPAQYVSGIPSAAILLSISHPIRCSTRCLANVRARISGPMIAL